MLQLACGWAMATMTSDAMLVASVQMAITVPAFLLAIPFGMVADSRGKRPLLCEMFPGERMAPAIALDSLGSKIGKVAGPAIGGCREYVAVAVASQ